MSHYQLYGIRLFMINVCVGMALFLPNCLAATDEVVTEVIIKLSPVRFPFSDLEEIEKTEFSSLVYRIGSAGGNT